MSRRLTRLSVLVMLCVLCLFQRSAVGEDKPAGDAVEKQKKMYMDYLVAEGFKPETESNANYVKFKHEGLVYHILIDTSDPKFFQLVLHFNVDLDTEEAMTKFLRAADYANKMAKVAKVYAYDSKTMYFSAEAVFNDPEGFKEYFYSYISMIQNGHKHFAQKWNE